MSSPYAVLDNRSIDQWKVTELKEELKRRKLITRGLKEDLIKRLDEAIRHETEAAKGDIDNGFHGAPPGEVETGGLATNSVGAEIAKDMELGDSRKEVDEEVVEIGGSAEALGLGKLQERGTMGGTDPIRDEELVVHATSVETSETVTESVGPEIVPIVEESQNSEYQKESNETRNESDDLNPHLESAVLENEEMVVHATSTENSVTVTQSAVAEIALSVQETQSNETDNESGDLKPHVENKAPKPAHEDVYINSSDPHNQVYEVSLDSGFQVKSDSNFTDCVSNSEKNELNDNIIANEVKLEPDVKPEMVQQLPNIVVPDSGKLHLMDVEESPEEKVFVEVRDDSKVANAEISEKNDSVDMGSSEKLNLDRSSGDDSMEEDAMDSKHTESQFNSDEVRDMNDNVEVTTVKEKIPVEVVLDHMPSDKRDVPGDNTKANLDASTVKRKLHDQAVGNNENLKRQRRWNSESHKVTLPQSNDLASSTTPKDTVPATSFTRSFSRSNSTVSENASKERVVPPSPKPPSNSLRIDRFLRPFTLKAVQELLGKTGTVSSFWMDNIKTHCYVTYSSVEEATETRNAVYNLQWPPNGGRLLVAEFVDPHEVKTRAEAPTQSPTTPVSTGPKSLPFPSGPAYPPAPSTLLPQPSPRQQVQAQRQHLPPPPPLPLPPPPPLSNPPQAREQHLLPPPPPLPEKVDPPIVTLDDLFRKTKATPRIYFLPLSDEQVAEKLKAKGTASKQ